MYLSEILQERQTALFEKHGVFFAFSNEQLKKGVDKYPGKKLVSLGAGTFCVKDNVKAFISDHEQLVVTCMKEDIEKHGLDGVIYRELGNHECFYTGDIEPAWDALKTYPNITRDMVIRIFNKHHR